MDFIRFVFDQGWWSVGLVLTCAIGYGIPYYIAVHTGEPDARWAGPNRLLGLLFGGPGLAVVYGVVLLLVADPEPACTEECWGRLGLGALALLGLIAWEVGLFAGCFGRYLHSRTRLRP